MTAYFAAASLSGNGNLTVPTIKPVVSGITVALTGQGTLGAHGVGFLTSPPAQIISPLQNALEFRVTKYSNTNMVTNYDEVLNGFVDGSWMDEVNGPGSGYVTLSTQHPKLLADPTLMSQRNWVSVFRNGAIIGRFVLQTKELILANEGSNGDLADSLWTLSGEGMRTLFHDAVVFPESGKVDKTTGDTRYFNFGSVNKSKWYVSSQWVTPSVGPKFLAANSYFGKEPAGYPIPNGYWIWASGRNSTTGYASIGYCYFRGEFTTSASNQTYSFYAAGDDGMNLFLDGVPIAATSIHQLSFANVTAVEGIALDPGSHVLSAQVYNAQGRAGFIACVRQDANDTNNTPVSTITYTGDTGHWTVCAYPPAEPGWTPGEVMLQLLGEAQARGVKFPQQITTTFTASADSAGVPWPSTGSYSFGTNTDYFDVLTALENDGVDAYVDPTNLHFNIYNQQGTDYSGGEGKISTVRYASLAPGSTGADMQCVVRVGSTGRYFVTQPHTEPDGVTQSTRVCRLDRSGTMIDQMVLNGAGHGTSIAVQVISGVEWVYVTWSKPTLPPATTDDNIVAFPWPTGVGTVGTRFNRSAVPGLVTILPGGGSYRNVQFDLLNNLAVVRTSGNTSDVYTQHTLANFLAGNIASPLHTVTLTQSANFGLDGNKTMQGFCSYQGYLFRYTGAPSTVSGGDAPALTQYAWSTGAVVATYDCSSLDTGYIHEPEGSTLFDVDGTNPTILLGMVTGPAGSHGFDVFSLPLNSHVNYANPPTLYLGRDIVAADEVSVAALKNGILAQTADGYVFKTDQNSINSFGRIEGGAQTSVTTANSGTILNKTLSLLSTPNVSTTYKIIDNSRITPGIDFGLGDWIMAPSMVNPPNSLAARRVMSITYSADGQNSNPNILYAIELDTIYQDKITNLTQLIAKLSSTDAVTGAATSQAIPTTSVGAPVSAGSPSTSTTTNNPPTTFAVGTITGTYDGAGKPTCALALSWVAPVDAEGNTQGVSYYEVYGSTASVPWGLLARVDGSLLTYTLDVTPVMTWTLGIRAHPAWNAALASDFSNQVVVTSVKPGTALDKPTTPTLSSDLGTISIHWDGQLTNGSPYAPPVQFTYVSAYIYTVSPSQSDIHQVSGLLPSKGTLVVTGLTVGTTYYAVLYANDTAGLTSAQSGIASIACVGVSQLNTDAAFQATIASISSTASAASAAASAASAAAATAQTTANGKNTVTYSSSAASGSGTATGDIWYQTSAGVVSGQWIWSGSTWVAQALSNAVLSSLDAGKITTGTLSSSRIAAGTIVASQLAIADFSNAASGSDFEIAGNIPWGATASWSTSTSQAHSGTTSWHCAGSGTHAASTLNVPVQTATGEQWYIEYWAYRDASWNGTTASKLQIANQASTVLVSLDFAAASLTASTWTLRSTSVTIASPTTSLVITLQTDGTAGNVYLDDIIIRRKNAGTLVVDGTITANSLASGSVTTAKLAAGAVTASTIATSTITANNMAAGAITADKIDLGTRPSDTGFNRVPNPLSNQTYWNMVIANNAPNLGGDTGATAGSTGISLLPTTSVDAYCYVALRGPVPASGSIYVSMTSSQNKAVPVVTWYTSGGTPTDVSLTASLAGVRYAFPATAVTYSVKIFDVHVASPVTDIVTFISVFEMIGANNGTNASSVELSPDGLYLYTGENQNPVLSLSASSNDILTMTTATGDQVATIDILGNGAFTEVSADADFDIAGQVLLGPSSNSLDQAIANGGVYDWGVAAPGDVSGLGILDIPGRSMSYGATWASQNNQSVTTQYYAICSDVFMVEDGRTVMLQMQNGALQASNSGGVNVYIDLQLCLTPMPAANGGTGAVRISRSVCYNGGKNNYVEAPTFWTTSASAVSIDTTNFILPANVPIYWQYNTDAGSAPTSFSFAEFGNTRQFVVIDLGSSSIMSQSGFATATDGRTSGGQTVTGGGTGTVTSTTKTFTASWSASYNSSGGSKVTGTGQWTNAKALYQGNGASPMGGQWGFSSTDLANIHGKTITSASIYMKNAYMAYSGSGVARIGTHNASAATSTIGNAYGGNEWGVTWTSGSSKWLTLSSTIRSGLSANTIKGFQVGVDGSNTDYMYFEGVGYGSHPPQLKVTYHT